MSSNGVRRRIDAIANRLGFDVVRKELDLRELATQAALDSATAHDAHRRAKPIGRLR